MILSTGASQFETLARLVEEDVDWRKVEMFHLDEYVGLDSILMSTSALRRAILPASGDTSWNVSSPRSP